MAESNQKLCGRNQNPLQKQKAAHNSLLSLLHESSLPSAAAPPVSQVNGHLAGWN
jgi:hypothetical protein